VLKAFRDDAECKRLHLREGGVFTLAIGQNAWQLKHFGQPAAVVFSLGLNLEGDQVLQPSVLDCTTNGVLSRNPATLRLSGREASIASPRTAEACSLAGRPLRDARLAHGVLERALQDRLVQMMTTSLARGSVDISHGMS
jgi:hypothetical protein